MTTTSPRVLAVARQLADDLLFPEAMPVEGLDALPAAHLDALAAEGLYGASVPVQSGGLGLDLGAACAVTEELASGCLTTTFVWLQHRGLSMTLAAEGTPAALRDQWLGPAGRGQVRGGLGAGRPGHGSPSGTGRKPVGHRGPARCAARPRGGVPAGVRVTAGDQERAAAPVRGQRRLTAYPG